MFKISREKWRVAQEAEARYWTELIDTQDERFFERTKEYYGYFKNHLANCEYDTVVEFGCGPVGLLPHIKARRKIGLDPLAFKYSRMGYDYNKRDYCIINAKGEDVPLLDCYADLIICVNVIDHSNDPLKMLEEIFRVCKHGGKIIISCDLRDRKSQTDPWHPILISAKDIEDFFKDKGCRIESQEILPPHHIMEGVDPTSGTLNIVVIKR